MSDFFRDRTLPKCRCAVRCINCGLSIDVGETYARQTGIWDGAWFVNRFHIECWDSLAAEDSGGFEFSPYSGEPPERLRLPAST